MYGAAFNMWTAGLDPRDPSIQIIPSFGPKVCKCFLCWAISVPRVGIQVFRLGAGGKLTVLRKTQTRWFD